MGHTFTHRPAVVSRRGVRTPVRTSRLHRRHRRCRRRRDAAVGHRSGPSSRVPASSRSSSSDASATLATARVPGRFGYQRLGDKCIRVGIASQRGVPADAVAAVVSVTAVSKGAGWNFVTVFPAGEPMPDTSSLNMSAFDGAVANLVTDQARRRRRRPGLLRRLRPDRRPDRRVSTDRRSGGLGAPRRVPVGCSSARHPLGRRSPAVGSISRVNLNGLVPSDATAVVGTLTAVTAVPCPAS